jgi:hypothetical protein
MRRSALVLILASMALVAPLLAACAEGGTLAAVSPDPFAGAWQSPERGKTSTLIIEKTSRGYHATLAAKWDFSLVRHGDRLTGMVHTAGGPIAVELTYLPGSQHLIWRNGTKAGASPSSWSPENELERIPSATASSTQL